MPIVLHGVRGNVDRRAALCLSGSILGMMVFGLSCLGLMCVFCVLISEMFFLLTSFLFISIQHRQPDV